ncbi:hypothetical protein BKA63DRAFT_571934 [Paraphoma chrysanthemicola]|nr:hypothetical protein BKA63DRAFT_571934 [Paraphoma chrysanthemicola]
MRLRRLEELEEEVAALKRQQLPAHPAASANHVSSFRVASLQSLATPSTTAESLRPLQEQHTARETTIRRTINGLELSPGIIDDCFKLYFQDYHPVFPLLNPHVNPNRFYERMPFLFWVIVSIGSRRYTEQPTLTPFLAQPVIQLALQSITTRNNPIERIKGLLLLLNWPFPSSAFCRDPSFLLAGTLLHVSMHCGLYAPTFSEDFTKSYTETIEQEHLRRAEIWAHVVIAYQMTCTGSGQPNLVSFELCNEQPHLDSLLNGLPMGLRTRLHLAVIMARANKAFLGLGLATMTLQQERTMDALGNGFRSEVDSLSKTIPALSSWDHLHVDAAILDLSVMQFYKSAKTLDMQSCTLVYDAASDVLERLHNLDQEIDLHRICTRFVFTVALLSLASMARVLKGPFASGLDQMRGHDLLNTGIGFLRSCSIQKGDFPAKCASFGEKMMNSKRMFRDPDGSINITLRVRNRLSGGPIHDAIRSWREEFSGTEFMHVAPGVNQDNIPLPRAPIRVSAEPQPNSVATGLILSSTSESWLEDDFWRDMDFGQCDVWDPSSLTLT